LSRKKGGVPSLLRRYELPLHTEKLSDRIIVAWVGDMTPDQMLPLHDGPIVKDGYIALPEKPGLGIDLNPDVVKAHLATGLLRRALAKQLRWWRSPKSVKVRPSRL